MSDRELAIRYEISRFWYLLWDYPFEWGEYES